MDQRELQDRRNRRLCDSPAEDLAIGRRGRNACGNFIEASR